MREYIDFFPHVMPTVPGCPEPMAISALREAAIEFCQRTRLWRYDDEFEVTGDDCDVVCVPSGAELLEIEHCTFNGFPLEEISILELDNEHPYWREDDQNTMPRYFTQIELDTIRVVPKAAGTVKVYTILMPSEDGDMVPDWLVTKFRRVIAAGALKDLLVIPGQPFFNPQLAAGFSARFSNALNTHGSMHVRGQQRAPLRTRANFF